MSIKKFLGLHEYSEDEVADVVSEKILYHIEDLPVHLQSMAIAKSMDKLAEKRKHEVELAQSRLEELNNDLRFIENYIHLKI